MVQLNLKKTRLTALVKSYDDDGNFGLHFPKGIEARELLAILKKTYRKIHQKIG